MRPYLSENQLQTLLAFYDQYGAEVIGHESEPPDSKTVETIERFVAGDLPEEQWNDFFALVADNPSSLSLIAQKLQPDQTADVVN